MYCTKCGQEIDENDVFCPSCSSKLNDEDYGNDIAIDRMEDLDHDDRVNNLFDFNSKLKNSGNGNVDQEYEKYKKSIFNKQIEVFDNDELDDFYDDDDGFTSIGSKILIILLVIAFVTATALAVKFFFFETEPKDITPPDQQSGQQQNNNNTQNPPDTVKEEPLSERDKILKAVTAYNENIQEVKSNSELKYNSAQSFNEKDVSSSVPVTNTLWKTIAGKEVRYEEAIIKALIQFNSKWIDYINNNDKTVLSLVEKNSKAYKNAVNFNKSGVYEEFLLFEIGEIRKGSKGYYVWTHEKIKAVKDGKSDIKEYYWVYKLVEGQYDFFVSDYYKYK